jgi:hypothetical protein
MPFDIPFGEAIKDLGPQAAFKFANGAKTPARYFFETLLPEQLKPTYHIEQGNMLVRATMAPFVGMDSPYPESGVAELTSFKEQTPKIANRVTLKEATLRMIQDLIINMKASSASAADVKRMVGNEVLNVLQKLILRSHFDAMEYLRGKALVTGAISAETNGITLSVNYGVPAGNFLTNRTGTAAYGGSASVFWSDIRSLQQKLRWNVRAFMMHPDTFDVVVSNPVNNIDILNSGNGVYLIRKVISQAGNTVPSPDARDRVEIITYDGEGEIFDQANPGKTTIIKFMPVGKVLAVANNKRNEYRVGEGSTDDPDADLPLGYTHIAPTVEGGAMGRWADQYTPQEEPWQLVSRGVTNGLPVIEAPEKIAVSSSDIP